MSDSISLSRDRESRWKPWMALAPAPAAWTEGAPASAGAPFHRRGAANARAASADRATTHASRAALTPRTSTDLSCPLPVEIGRQAARQDRQAPAGLDRLIEKRVRQHDGADADVQDRGHRIAPGAIRPGPLRVAPTHASRAALTPRTSTDLSCPLPVEIGRQAARQDRQA